TVFIMWDYDYLHDMSKGIQTIFTYGTKDADVVGTSVPNSSFLKVAFSKGLNQTITTHLVGDYNLPNVLAAVAVGTYFNVPEEKIKAAIESYAPSNSRSQLVERGSNKIILDAYNANPSSMKVAIENFAKAEGNNKILVLGAMAELGEESIAEHQSIIAQIQSHPWKAVLLVGGDFQKIQHPFLSFTNATEAGEWLKENSIQDSFLLIKGSRSMQMEKTLNYI
ncbi:MAG: UDP-N-acetylmuramoylalanyl-D-glutamate--2,6-diaminopimelate ligase, partial [Chitinophagaceae bacterium]